MSLRLSDYDNIKDFLKKATKAKKKDDEISEAYIEKHFVDYCSRQGCKAYKLIFLMRKGFPDRTVLLPGARVFFVEFKRKGKTLSKQQLIIKKILVSLGFTYIVADEIGIAEAVLDGWLWD